MCRLLAYVGDPILLAHLVLWPDRSIIRQSYDAHERKMNPSLPSHLCHGNLNGDGFGIGWYSQEGSDTSPCVFTSVTPAWNNENLARLSRKITSPLIFAHVRAAYPGMPVSEQNCHPFMWGRYMWMHNGVVGDFSKIKRRIVELLSDEAYNTVTSFHSDSAASFALFLHHLPSMTAPQTPDVLLQAMQMTLASIATVQEEMGATSETSLLNFVVSDGNTVIATRYVSPNTEEPASLYFAEGSAFQREVPAQESANEGPSITSTNGENQYELTYGVRGTCVAIIASEPITGSRSDWVAVPKNTCVVVSREKSGFVNIMNTPRTCDGQEEVSRCLEAVSRGIGVTARQWTFRDGRPGSVGSDVESCMVVDKPDHRLTGHTAAILALELDPECKRLFSSSADGSIKVWDVDNCTPLTTLVGHRKPVLKLAVHGEHLYSTGGSRIRIWDLKTYECVYVGHVVPGSGALRALAVSNGVIHVGGQDSIVKNLQPSNPDFGCAPADEELVTTSTSSFKWSHLSAVHSIETCGKYICSAGGDSMIRVWKADTLEYVRVLRGHRGSILTLKGVDNMLYSGGRDNTVRVWDMEALLCRRLLAGHKDDITHISAHYKRRKFTSQSKHQHNPSMHQMDTCFVATASADCTVRVW